MKHALSLAWSKCCAQILVSAVTSAVAFGGDQTVFALVYQATLHGDVISSGVELRGSGTGVISLTGIPPGSTVERAWLYWSVLLQTPPGNGVYFTTLTNAQGTHSVLGQLHDISGDPCWPNPLHHHATYIAVVDSLILGDGDYGVSFVDSGNILLPPSVEGASLVVVYTNPSLPSRRIMIRGGDSGFYGPDGQLTIFRNFTASPFVVSARLTFIISDGQPGFADRLSFNGYSLTGNDACQSFWEDRSFDVSTLMQPSAQSAIAAIEQVPGQYDCLVWIAAILSVSVDPPTRLPLGGQLAGNSNPGVYRVYVPARAGGQFTVGTTSGTIINLRKPSGEPFTNGDDVGTGDDVQEDNHGWYTFQVAGSESYTVSNTFVQHGETSIVPWNFWYFPMTSLAPAPRLFDVGGACAKYDAAFGLGSQTIAWEQAHHGSAPELWWGHCDGAAVASVVLQQPVPAPGFEFFNQDELEGLAAEFFCKYSNAYCRPLAQFPPYATNNVTGYRATVQSNDPVDAYVHQFHEIMRKAFHDWKRPLWLMLRQPVGINPENEGEVWNQACFRFRAEMQEDPDALGDPDAQKTLQIKISNAYVCNDDFVNGRGISVGTPADQQPFRRREEVATYVLMYDADGNVVPNGTIAGRKQNWLSTTLTHTALTNVSVPREVYVPFQIRDMRHAGMPFVDDNSVVGDNIHITAARLISLGLQKNPGF